MAAQFLKADELLALVGKDLKPSDWILIDQARINAFADATGDHQYIHVDPGKAKATPFGGTIAHGLLLLSLLPALFEDSVPMPADVTTTVNYGYNKIRFLTPVRSGKRVRAKFVISEFTEPKPGRYQQVTTATIEIEGESKPALIAEWIGIGLGETEGKKA